MSKAPILNLARKWRSQNFDQIIGQDLVVRMLKNSLYLSYYFPVYLFMGQRGSGKTSTARIFAASVNCQKKELFQENPKKNPLPCLECISCVEIKQGKHPDFIEIDAASHTGVDNVRHIIESSSFMPVRGRKKIYLIDEAHMLSKAAFNAFLKILEEPPASALFILATTDAQKIIDTVKSRCFQLFFKPIAPDVIAHHLSYICDNEKIAYQKEGLTLIAQEAHGSVRDAQNILEQVRFSANGVTKKAVLTTLGYVNDEDIITLLDATLNKDIADLLQTMRTLNIIHYEPLSLWRRLQDLMRAIVWCAYTGSSDLFARSAAFDECAKKCALQNITRALEIFYSYELLFLKTTAQHALLEMILLRINRKNVDDISSTTIELKKKVVNEKKQFEYNLINDVIDTNTVSEKHIIDNPQYAAIITVDDYIDTNIINKWNIFLDALVQSLPDQLVISLFKQAHISWMEQDNMLIGSFTKDMIFFLDLLTSTQPTWHILLKNIFNETIIFKPLFNREKDAIIQVKNDKKTRKEDSLLNDESSTLYEKKIVSTQPKKTDYRPKFELTKRTEVFLGKKIDITDTQEWPLVHKVLSYFPGIVSQIEQLPSLTVLPLYNSLALISDNLDDRENFA